MKKESRDPRRDPVHARHLEVAERPNESPERMIKRFTKKVRNEGILQELYQRRSFEKPSQKVRRKRARADFNRRLAIAQLERN